MNKAFTLIELLIVVAIIAILAAIAVPNFLEAQTRAKVTRMKSDMRTMTTGLETYTVDWNQFPLCNNFALAGARSNEQTAALNPERQVLERISTPIAYLTSGFIKDVFDPQTRRSTFSAGSHQGTATDISSDPNKSLIGFVKYAALNPSASGTAGFADVEAKDGPAKAYILTAAGPNRSYPNMGTFLSFGSVAENNNPSEANKGLVSAQFYDPTNGTASYGYVFRTGGTSIQGSGYGSEFMRQSASKQ